MKKQPFVLLVLLLTLTVMTPMKAESVATLQPDTPSAPIDFLLALTRDGIVKVSLSGATQLLIPDVGASYSLQVQNDNIYVSSQTRGGAILVYGFQGNLLRTISTPPQASQKHLTFVVLPGDRFALLDNDTDKVFFSDALGHLLATTIHPGHSGQSSPVC